MEESCATTDLQHRRWAVTRGCAMRHLTVLGVTGKHGQLAPQIVAQADARESADCRQARKHQRCSNSLSIMCERTLSFNGAQKVLRAAVCRKWPFRSQRGQLAWLCSSVHCARSRLQLALRATCSVGDPTRGTRRSCQTMSARWPTVWLLSKPISLRRSPELLISIGKFQESLSLTRLREEWCK